MLSGALHLHARPAHQLMVPRPQMVAIDVDTSVDETMATLARSSFTRIPVFKGDPANVIGIVHAKDAALRLFSERPAASTRDLLRPIPMVPETLPGDRVLQALRDARAQMAIVQDEHGTAVGIITFEDVLAEMLGGGAARPPRAELVVEPLGEGKARLPGLLPIARAPPWLPIPDGSEAHTVAGLVLEHAGGIPRVGDVIVLGGLRLSIERMTGRRVDSVIVEGLPHDEDPGSAPGGDARG